MKRLKKIYLKTALIAALVLIACMVAGSFFDFQISKALYPGHEGSVGQFFAAFGELPMFMLISGAGALLFTVRTRLRSDWNLLFILAAVILCVGAIAYGAHEAHDNVSAMPLWVAVLVTAFFCVLTMFGLLILSRGCSARTVLRFLCTVVFVCVVTTLLVNLIKIPWGRARMRLIAATGNESFFTPWWKIGTDLKERLVADGIDSHEFRSFPSGHTACAACAMLALLLPTLSRRWRGKERLCVLIGAAWTLVVAVSRIFMGAHFLTDVAAAALIFLAVSALGIYLFYFNHKVFRFLWGLLAEQESRGKDEEPNEQE